jgi:hypothetical protein
MSIMTLDIEASGLGDESYPIQIGYSFEEKGKLVTKEFFIKPAEHWEYWDDEAEEFIHHIPRQALKNGLSIQDACEKLNLDLIGAEIIVDSKEYDVFWLEKLFSEAQVNMGFNIINIDDYLFKKYGVKNDRYEQERELHEFSHSAGEDSKVIYEILNAMT